jgi:hypothetical protein
MSIFANSSVVCGMYAESAQASNDP